MKPYAAFAVLSLLFAVSLADASHCGTVVVGRAPVVHRQHHVAPYVAPISTYQPVVVVAATPVVIPLVVPTFTVQGPPLQAAPVFQGQQFGQQQAVPVPQQQLAPQQQQAPKVPQQQEAAPAKQNNASSAIGDVLSKCVACHDSTVSKSKGGDFSMFANGQTVAINDKQALAVLARTHRGEMPPNAKLENSELAALSAWVAGAK